MSIVSHSLPVPGFGTGAPVDVGDLVDSATVVLAGDLAGDYVLCAGHDPSALVPVSRLNDDGQSEITALEALAYRYAAVRVVGNARPSVGVTVVMSGLSRPGENNFGTLAVLAPGSFGAQPSADTYSLFPPTGLETELNLICRGSFEGPIIVEGSTNNVEWNPVASFQAGLTNNSFPVATVLEFSPVKIADKVRYFRVVVTGRILATTYVTLGGRVPASGGGGGSPTGPAGGELTGTYPNPSLSTAAVQSKALAVCDPAGAAATVQGNLNTHAGLTTSAHGGIVASSAVGAPGGVASLALDGKVPLSELPPLGGAPSGPAGGELTGTYPNPSLSTTAVQTKALAVCDPAGAAAAALTAAESYTDTNADPAGAAATVQGNLNTHAGLTTSAHGGLVPATRQVASGNGLSGGGSLASDRTLTVSPDPDGSISVAVAGVKVGILATDAQHGARGGGTQHATAVAGGAAGFISGANQTKLDSLQVLTTKGDLVTSDGSAMVVLPVGAANGMRLTVDSASPNGIAWKTDPAASADGSIFSMIGPTGAPNAIVAYNYTLYDPAQTLAQNLAASNLSGNPVYNLVAVGTPAYNYSAGLGSAGPAFLPYLASVLGGGLLTSGTGNSATTAIGTDNTLRITGSITVEILLVFGALSAGNVQLFSMTAPGETSDSNTLYALFLSGGSVLAYGCEHDAGLNIDASFATAALSSPVGNIIHITLTRDVTGHVTVYCNGRRASPLTTPVDAGGGGIIVPNYGPNPQQNLIIGPTGVAANLTWYGAKITAAQFTDAQVQESYRRTFFGRI